MQRLCLDFLGSQPSARSPGQRLLAAGVLAIMATFLYAEQIATKASLLEAQLQQMARESAHASHRAGREASGEDVDRRAQQNFLIPWPPLFEALEATTGSNISLISLEADGIRKKIQITGNARDMNTLTAYVLVQEKTAALGNVHLRHSDVKSGLYGPYIQFALEASWERP